MRNAECPECGAGVSLADNVQISEIVNCSDCQVDLEVTGVGPDGVTLAPAPEEDEDWGE